MKNTFSYIIIVYTPLQNTVVNQFFFSFYQTEEIYLQQFRTCTRIIYAEKTNNCVLILKNKTEFFLIRERLKKKKKLSAIRLLFSEHLMNVRLLKITLNNIIQLYFNNYRCRWSTRFEYDKIIYNTCHTISKLKSRKSCNALDQKLFVFNNIF